MYQNKKVIIYKNATGFYFSLEGWSHMLVIFSPGWSYPTSSGRLPNVGSFDIEFKIPVPCFI